MVLKIVCLAFSEFENCLVCPRPKGINYCINQSENQFYSVIYIYTLFKLHLTPDYHHTCNLETGLVSLFTPSYEILYRSRVNTTFVVLTPHCSAKHIQCEMMRVGMLPHIHMVWTARDMPGICIV